MRIDARSGYLLKSLLGKDVAPPFLQRTDATLHVGPIDLCSVVTADSSRAEIVIKNPKGEKEQPKAFTFDSAYGSDSTQRQIYDRTASMIVGSSQACVSFRFEDT